MLGQGNVAGAERLLRDQLALTPRDVQTLRILALILQSQDRSDEAIATLRAAISYEPNSAHTHADIGALYRTLKRPQHAAAALRRALAIDGSMSKAWRLLGDVLVDQGEHSEASEAFNRSLATDRFSQDIAAAGAHLARGDLQAAEAIFRQILKQEAGHVGAICGLAAVATAAKQATAAERLLRQALRQSAHLPLIWRGLSQVFLDTGRLGEAEDATRYLLKIEPASARNFVTLGTVLSRRLRQEEALAAYKQALSLNPDQPRVVMSKGHLLKTLGRRAECEAAYRRCIQMEPANGEFYWCLADLKTYRFSDAEVAAMDKALTAPDADIANAALLNFAMGRAHEQRENYPQAFACYAAANAARRRSVHFDAAAFECKSRRIIETFDAAFLSARLSAPSAAPAQLRPAASGPAASGEACRPIFIVGLPRSGSTLVEQILASHSQVEGTMELPNMVTIVRELDSAGGQGDTYPESVPKLAPEKLRALGDRYLTETRQFRSGRPYFVDKLPNNFSHAGLIILMLPGALIIDVRRHPMDACFSAYKQYFAQGQSFSYDLEDLGRYYRCYLALMDHWHAVLPGRVLTVSYEALVRDTENQVRRLLAHCALDFEPACLRFHETQRPVRTASSEQVRQPIYGSGIGHWRHFAAQLAPLARALGDSLARYE
jgi:tetratricopeptide (TPR) repeat protein